MNPHFFGQDFNPTGVRTVAFKRVLFDHNTFIVLTSITYILSAFDLRMVASTETKRRSRIPFRGLFSTRRSKAKTPNNFDASIPHD